MSCVQLVPLFGEERSEKGKTGRCLSRSTISICWRCDSSTIPYDATIH